MHRDIKLVLIVFLNFVYSISLLGISAFYSLTGIVARDSINIIVTEATGLQRQETMLSANLLPTELQGLFWLSIAGAAFCLIFVFLLTHNFHSLSGPAALSVIVFFLILSLRGFLYGFIPAAAGQATSTPYVLAVLERLLHSGIVIFFFGLLLFYIALKGDQYFKKQQPTVK